MPFLVFYVTCPDEKTASSISEQLLQRRLIACSNVFPVTSAYRWSNAVQQEGEWVALLKTGVGLEHALEKALSELHPYEVPCFMRVEVRANADYENWVIQETSLAVLEPPGSSDLPV